MTDRFAEDDLAELVGQLLADLLARGGRDFGQVEAAEGALRVAAEVGGQEGAEGGAGRGDLGGDVEGGGLLVAVLEDFAAPRPPSAGSAPPCRGRTASGRPAGGAGRSGRRPGRTGRKRRSATSSGMRSVVDIRGAEDLFQPDGEQVGVARGRPAARSGRGRRSLRRCTWDSDAAAPTAANRVWTVARGDASLSAWGWSARRPRRRRGGPARASQPGVDP